ncbi:MAG: DUF2341 domain-containing protein [Planctomycetes bacterium]|nr:DUF2341 domain-containing protein [Planctomycetota bacterium]
MKKLKPVESNPLIHIPAKSGLRPRPVFCILSSVSCFLFSLLLFADTWLQTTTSDFNTAGSSTSNTEVINDTVQLSAQSNWWKTPAGWWNTDWLYSRPITVANNSGGTLADYQVLVEPLRDSGDFRSEVSGQIGSWPFSEGAGSGTTADASGQGNTGILNGTPAWSTGRFGNAIRFDGLDDYVSVTNNAGFDFGAGDFTIEFWFNPATQTRMALFAGTTDFWLGIDFNWQGTRNVNIWASSTGTNWNLINADGGGNGIGSQSLTLNQWSHVAYVRSGNQWMSFINGVRDVNITVAGTVITRSENKRIGLWGNSSIPLNGSIDEVKIYKGRALTAEEVAMRYGSGLVGSWHFSESLTDASNVATDMSGFGNSGALNNSPTRVAGRFGNAISFNGTTQYVAVPDHSSLDMTADLTVEAWIKPNALPGAEAVIFNKGNGTTDAGSRYELMFTSAGKAKFDVFVGATKTPATGVTTLSLGQWYHIVGVRIGSNHYVYVNGALDGYASLAGSLNAETNPLSMGRLPNSVYYFNGVIDEARVYNRALSASEIAARYNGNTPKVRHDYADVRFTNSDSTQALSFWQETDSRFWIKVPSLLSGNNTIKMYYGNAAAIASSSGADTFAFFDDFDDGALKSGWTFTDNGNAANTYSETTVPGKMTMTTASSDAWGATFNIGILYASQPSGDWEAITEVNVNGDANYQMFGLLAYSDDNNWYRAGKGYHSSFSNENIHYASELSGVGDEAGSVAHPADLAHVKIRKSGNNHYAFWSDNPVSWNSIGNTKSISTDKIGIFPLKTTAVAKSAAFDNFRIRKYSSVEPAHTAPGTEASVRLSNSGGGTWQYFRPMTIANNSGGALTDYQFLLEPFRDTGDFLGANLDTTTSLVGYWPFSEGTGTAVADTSGKSNNGTLNGTPSWAVGRYGNAILFDGVDDWINLPASPDWDWGGTWTLSVWLKPSAYNPTYNTIYSWGTGGNWIQIFLNGSGQVLVSTNTQGEQTWTGQSVPLNKWSHLTMVSTGGSTAVYINGLSAGTKTLTVPSVSINVRIGWDGVATRQFIGTMDEFRIYKGRAFSVSEVSTSYGSGIAGSWHFSDGTGQSVTDMSGNGNNGQLGSTAGSDVSDPVWTASGKAGNALSFDGTDDYVSIADNASLNVSNISVEAWIKTPNQTVYKFIVQKYNVSSPNQGFALAMNVTTSNQLGMWVGGGAWTYGNFTWDGAWHHIVGIYNGTTVYLYVDGNLIGTPQALTGNMSYAVPLYIGTYAGTTGTYNFSGLIDEVRIYNRALSASEITARYAAGVPKYRYDFADIRFANSDSSQELAFFQETDTKFRIKIPSLPVGDTNVNMYYGNTLATNAGDSSQILKSRIISYYTLNESSGNTIDRCGKYNGTATGTAYSQAGKVNTAYGFGGDGDKVDFGQQSEFDFGNNNFTFSLWVYPTETVGFYEYFFGYVQNDSAGPWLFGRNTSGNLRVLMAHPTTWDTLVDTTLALPTNNWSHIVIVRNGTNVYPYVNNSAGALIPNVDTLSTQATRTLKIGTYGGGEYFQGSIDEVGIWNRALTSDEISQLYGSGNGKVLYVSPEPTHTVPGAETLPYNTTGTFTSSAKDTGGDNTVIDSVSWTQTGSGAFAMQIRSANSDPAGWTGSSPAWEDVSNGDTSVAEIGRYIQYRGTYTGSGNTAEPVLTDVTVTYTVPIIPPADSVSCDKLANSWYSTAVFTFTNDAGFGVDIDRYYYAWDNTASYAFTLAEPVWNSSTPPATAPQLLNYATSDGSWYFHYLPYSSTDTSGTAQDLGPFKYDGTAPAATSLLLPANNESISTSTAGFSWQPVTDASGITYTLQMDYYTFFSSPLVNRTGISAESYTLNGAGQEKLVGSTTYYWRLITTDGAGNSANSAYLKFSTTSAIPQITNTMTGESYSTLQDAIDGANTVDGDVIRIQDTVAHDENVIITKDVILENAILSPLSGFAVTGQGASGGEVLRNCVITSGGVSDLALGENLTIYNPAPSATATIQNSKLINCLIESGTVIINSTIENCYTEATSGYFVDAANNDFHLSDAAVNAIDSGKNLNAEFTADMENFNRGIDILQMPNFDTAAWDIGAYEFQITTGYINPPQAPSVPTAYFPADGAGNMSTDVVLIWYPSAGSTPMEYAVQVSTSADMSVSYYSAANITDAFAGISGLPYNTVFYWQVKASNGAGESAWSSVFDFTTQVSAGTAPSDYSVIAVSPSSLAFSAEYGNSTVTAQKINITNSGTTDFDWTLASDAAWLTVSPSEGNSSLNSDITVSVNPDGLSVGQHSGAITITAPEAVNTPVSAVVTILISMDSATAKNYDITAAPSALIFNITSGSAVAQTKELFISHDIAVNFAWTILTDADWLTVTPSEGTSYQAATLNITVDPAGLETGVYSSMITVNTEDAKNSPISVPVTVYVIAGNNGGTSPATETTSAPDKPELLSPFSGEIFYVSMPALQWESASGATYWIQVGKDQDFTDIVVNKVLDSAQYQAHDLESDMLYFWRVKAINSSGMSDWSDTSWFRLSSNSEGGKETPKACFLTKLRIRK